MYGINRVMKELDNRDAANIEMCVKYRLAQKRIGCIPLSKCFGTRCSEKAGSKITLITFN